MAHDLIFEIHRRDPFAAGFDDVLRAIGDLNVASSVHSANVAGAQPAVVEALRRGVFIVRGGDPGTADLDLADRLSVPGQLVSRAVGEAHLDAGEGDPRL